MRAFLDEDLWSAWATDVSALAEGLQKVKDDLERRASAEVERKSKVQKTVGMRFVTPDSMAPIYRSKTAAVKEKYTSLNSAMGMVQTYKPISLANYEPLVRSERFEYVRQLELDVPIAILKVDVGGSIGTLYWVLRRESDTADDGGEVQAARELIKPLIPNVHSRAIRRMVKSRMSSLVKMTDSIRDVLYTELTGDESQCDNMAVSERTAFLSKKLEISETFALAVGDPDLILDLRAITMRGHIGQTTFSEFWLCVEEVLDAMNTAAEERRHGGVVAYLSEVISSRELFDRCKVLLDTKVEAGTVNPDAKVPSIAWFKYQFWPSNEHVRSALLHTGRFPLRLQLQVRNLRKEHGHAYYCAKQKSLAKEFVIKYRDYACAIQPDDKQNLNIGEPGTAASVLAKQKPTMGTVNPATAEGNLSGQQNQTAISRAIDHDAGSVKMRIIPTVHLVQDIPTNRDETMCRGQVYITLKNSIFEPSEANKAMLEIEKSLKFKGSLKSIVWEHADGGGEHHTGHPSVIVATINFWLRNNDQVDRIVKTRGAPYHSYLHEVEKVMSILNIGLYNVAIERPRIDQSKFPGMEARFQSCKNMAELRSYGAPTHATHATTGRSCIAVYVWCVNE